MLTMRIKGREGGKLPYKTRKTNGGIASNRSIMWKEQLTTLYCTDCRYYDSGIREQVQRQSNNFAKATISVPNLQTKRS